MSPLRPQCGSAMAAPSLGGLLQLSPTPGCLEAVTVALRLQAASCFLKKLHSDLLAVPKSFWAGFLPFISLLSPRSPGVGVQR